MKLIANTADRLLSAIVPRTTAAAWSCPAGCGRSTCYCGYSNGGYYWFNECLSTHGGYACKVCTVTVWKC